MKTNRVKRLLAEGKPTFGTWITIGALHAVRWLSRIGFDWLTVDLEHSPIDWSQASTLFAAIADNDCVPLARIPLGDQHLIKRALDAGAWGVVVPLVETVEQAQQVIQWCKYPPQGIRTAGGTVHSLGFRTSAQNYFTQANDEIVIILQTESWLGLKNASQIYGIANFDAVFIGPIDLRLSLEAKQGRKISEEEFEAAVQRVIDTGRMLGKPTGMHCFSVEDALKRAKQGMQFLAIGSDFQMLTTEATRIVRSLHPDKLREAGIGY